MQEHLRALIVILAFAILVFSVYQRPSRQFVEPKDYERRRNTWFLVTLALFSLGNFWLYVVFILGALLVVRRFEENVVALFFLILCAVPVGGLIIPGFGGINYFFSISHQRILVLTLFLPLAVTLARQPESPSYGRIMADKILALYLVLILVVDLPTTSGTDIFRSAFNLIVDILVPYFVVSRSLKTIKSIREVILSLLIAGSILGLLGAFESVKHWLLYASVISELSLDQSMTNYLGRAGVLRAITTYGHPIAFGYVMAITLGLYLYLWPMIQSRFVRWFALGALVAGLISSLSRGPWLGVAVLISCFILTGKNALRRIISLVAIAASLVALLSTVEFGRRILSFLPFFGDVEIETIDYREKLLENALIVISRNMFFGSSDYLKTPEMEAMRQGQGIIDLVNTYVQVALETGVVGLSLFLAFFISVIYGVRKSTLSLREDDQENQVLGRALYATILALMVIIFTVSSISVIPIFYWSIAGIGVAYSEIIRRNQTPR